MLGATKVYFSELIGTLAVILAVSAFIGSSELFSKLTDHINDWKRALFSGLLGGMIGIYGNLAGIEYRGAIISIRDIGPMLSGMIGGPFAGALGGLIAGSALMLRMPLYILIVGMIYLIEVLSVMLQVSYFKLTHGKRIFRMAPIHHHFELSGWSETQVVARFSIATVILAAIGLLAI